MFRELRLDVSELEAPDPFTEIINLLPKLHQHCYINLIHRQEPFPLYKVLIENGLQYTVVNLEKVIKKNIQNNFAKYSILIWLSTDNKTAKYCQQLSTTAKK